ncbi:GNAT family N-acetyltransferase [Sanguibacter sp. 4.1]|uniref:GNAT family N-acetyltransferase n=1 Tax=Sanguibacter biliveldensis TaxID=3030830 RepID=A0AAF0Z5K0_9MICO|nr:GNAT family N-acetyltransferase [Sanguibacter sp. 4.1]WPF81532.1 GNAT family N-acetyltransferase [Sanguibacter sp. 4.1]
MTHDGTSAVPATHETTISPVTRDDERAVVALWEAAGLTRPWNDPAADLRSALETPTSTVLGARLHDGALPDGALLDNALLDGTLPDGAVPDSALPDSTLVGTVMVGYDGHRGWVYYLAVDEAQRGTGLGRALMVAAEAWLVSQGAPKVQLMVRTTNTAVLGFYAALGYTDQSCVVLGRRTD